MTTLLPARRLPPPARFALALAGLIALGTPVIAEAPWRAGDPISLDRIGAGELLWQREDGYVPLPAARTEVSLAVTGIMLRGRVVQRFSNPTEQVIEALYVFPLPDRAAVHRMELIVGARRIRAVVKEKQQARQTYEQAREEGRKAALLDQRRANLFTIAAANINPGELVEVELEFVQEVDYTDGVFSLRFPLTSTPRYSDPQLASEATALSALEPVARAAAAPPLPERPFVSADSPLAPRVVLRASVDAGVPLEMLESHSHDVDLSWEAERWIAEPPSREIPADRDFVLGWRPQLGHAPQAAMHVEQREDGDYVLLMLVPPEPDSEIGHG
ncbi:MAG: hypothetical protein JSV80_01510, partial [Acidobacteriota bacterium]